MIPGIVASQGRLRTPPQPTLERLYWRILTSALDGGAALSIAEMQLYSLDALLTNLAAPGGGAFAFGSPNYGEIPDYGPARAFDGNVATIFATLPGAVQHLGWRFATPQQIGKVAIVARNTTYGESPRDFVIQSSDDGVNWRDEWGVTGASDWADGTDQREFFRRPVEVVTLGMDGPDSTNFTDAQGRSWVKVGVPRIEAGVGVFNGSSAIRLPDAASLRPVSGDWTIEIDAMVTHGGNQVLFGKNSGGFSPYGVGVFGGKLQMLVAITSGGGWASTAAAAADFPIGVEQHCVLQRHRHKFQLIQNGELVAESNLPRHQLMPSNADLTLGAWTADASSFPLNGTLRRFKFTQGAALYSD